jgi:NhaP-type Na+/H+ or K+/H+ antiporter
LPGLLWPLRRWISVYTWDPEVALTLFVAPVLLDAAYDTSLRDLKRHWVPVASLVLIVVGLTRLHMLSYRLQQ